ncbi:MAG TPA: DUF1837 domain-containing protein [Candidatus Angelobacter sp.]|nr:DUF1837 domain-containing protein [Candidatus Angelobacter sp.]
MASTPSRQDPRQKNLFSAPAEIKPRPASRIAHPDLTKFLNVTQQQYDACLTHVDHNYSVNGSNVNLRFHYVRLDSNGRPKFKDLAEVLARHIGYYALTAQRHSLALSHTDHVKLFLEAKKLLRRNLRSGEPGEILLYFLIEAVLKAPQAICKMSLKTNRKEEIKGSDGLHVKWDSSAEIPIIYFGEAKLYKNLSAAISAVFKSLQDFHAEGAEAHELFLATNHFNLLDERLKHDICAFLDRTLSVKSYELRHACLVGFDWKQYADLESPATRAAFVKDFEKFYLNHGKRIRSLINKHSQNFKHKHLMIEFFFLPFKSVQEFRKWFLEEVFGEVSE